MSLKERLKIKLNPAFYWRAGLWLCCIAFVGLSVCLWLNASTETADALASSRRIIIRLSDGSFEKIGNPEIAAEAAEPGANATPTAEIQETATETANFTATETATASGTAVKPPAEITPAPEAPVPSNTAIVPLNPIKDTLREKLSVGTLPIIAPDGTKPWRYYAKPYALKGNHPMIAILVTGLGQNKSVTGSALKLPENISLSFSPYAKDAGTWSNAARATGHEVLLDIPMEPTNYPASDPGPHGLLVGKSAGENATHLQWLLGRTQGYTGFATAPNEAYSQNDTNFRLTLELLNVRGLMLAMPHEPVRTETRQILDDSKIAYTVADIVLDEELSSEAIQERLTALEKQATRRGYAVGYTRGMPLTILEIANWSATMEERGYTLVPVTYVTSLKFKQ